MQEGVTELVDHRQHLALEALPILDSHTARRWIAGEQPIPRWVGAFLDLAAELRETRETWAIRERMLMDKLRANLFTG